ncbi:MAG: TonB C-terminal domain-containing protein [Myxococcota bacterium]|nr:TonB C-terminal domain-containing protein [Myxococcota bacterium]
MTDLTQITIDLDPEDRRLFRRVLVFSAVVHVVGFAFFALVPSIPTVSPPPAIAVSLVAPSLSRPAPAAPAPPRAKPKPRPPKPAPVVLPTEATVPKPKPRREVKPRPEPRVEPAPAVPAEQTQDYTDVLASLRQQAGEEAPRPATETARASETARAAVAPAGAGPGVPVSAEVRAWMTKTKIRIKDNWVVPANFRMHAIVAEVRIDVGASGHLVGEPRLLAGSGNPYYDDGVLNSIRKADPLPPPPEPGQWTFRFVSDEY